MKRLVVYTSLLAVALLPGRSLCEPPKTPPGPASARVAPDAALPVGDATLSLMRPQGDQCAWLRLNPTRPMKAQSVVIAEFPGTCDGAQLAFDSKVAQALVWFWDSDAPSPKRPLYRVDIATGRVTELPMPAWRGVRFIFDERGEVFALWTDPATDAEIAAEKKSFEGQEYKIVSDRLGSNALAHAYRLRDRTWIHQETKPTTTQMCLAVDTRALDIPEHIGPTTDDLLSDPFSGHERGDRPMPENLVAQLNRAFPPRPDADGEWEASSIAGRDVYNRWDSVNDIFAYQSTPLVWKRNGKLELIESGNDPGRPLLPSRGKYLLLSASYSGDSPFLYDVSSQRLLFSDPNAHAAFFWPTAQEHARLHPRRP